MSDYFSIPRQQYGCMLQCKPLLVQGYKSLMESAPEDTLATCWWCNTYAFTAMAELPTIFPLMLGQDQDIDPKCLENVWNAWKYIIYSLATKQWILCVLNLSNDRCYYTSTFLSCLFFLWFRLVSYISFTYIVTRNSLVTDDTKLDVILSRVVRLRRTSSFLPDSS